MEQAFDNTLGKKEWNKVITTEVGRALGAQLDGDFTAVNYNAGFNYIVRQLKYNSESLRAFDTKVVVIDGVPVLDNGYSDLYRSVIDSICFTVSKVDKAKMREELTKQAALIHMIIDAYKDSGIDDGKEPNPSMPYIMGRIRDVTGTTYDKVDPMDYPYLAPLCNYLCEFAREAVHTAKINLAASEAQARMNNIKDNIKKPSEINGGLETEKGYKISWDNIPGPEQLLESLSNSNNKIAISLTANNFHDQSTKLSFKNKVNFVAPVNWFFRIEGDHSNQYDFSKYTKNGAEISVTIGFGGITVLPVNPTALSADYKKGWYASDILAEAAAKSGKDITGYQLASNQYDPKTLFGKEGELRRLRTMVISQLPSITMHFSKFDCEALKKLFSEKTKVNFSVLGGAISGSSENGYKVTESNYNESSQSLDVTFTPPSITGAGSAAQQKAFVLGGVVDYFRNDVKVNKIRILTDENSVGESCDIPEGCRGLNIMYRKNEDGKYEYAGLYDENKDLDYMIGDTIAVPITSHAVGVSELPINTPVWNVIGSTGDHCHGHGTEAWIKVWSDLVWNGHVPDGALHSYVCIYPDCHLNCRCLVGGHMTIDERLIHPSRNWPDKERQFLYIIPICQRVNNRSVVRQLHLNGNVRALVINRFQDN